MDAYERLIGDAMLGDATLFGRQDEVEAAWRIVDPVLRDHADVHIYAPDTWGPAAAETMLRPYGGWRAPAADGTESGMHE